MSTLADELTFGRVLPRDTYGVRHAHRGRRVFSGALHAAGRTLRAAGHGVALVATARRAPLPDTLPHYHYMPVAGWAGRV